MFTVEDRENLRAAALDPALGGRLEPVLGELASARPQP
jgi:hypothetical protein